MADPTYQRALAHWQNILRGVLSDYVNGSLLRKRVKWLFPFAWGISAYSARLALTRLAYATYPLVNCARTSALAAFLDQIDSPVSASREAEAQLCRALTTGYSLLAQLVDQGQNGHTATLCMNRKFDETDYQRADGSYFAPVIRLARFIRQRMAADLKLAIIHGSVGDLAYAKGYSDLDTLLVLNEATVTDATRLRRFAQACYRSLAEVCLFDPLQHHGHMIATAIDLRWYSENWLPVDSFRYARSIVSGEDRPEVFVRDSAPDAHQNIEELHELMLLRRAQHWSPATAFELKDYLSVLMLAPALYLQAKGLYLAKQDSFQLAHDHLSNANWDAMRDATQVRAIWPYYRDRLVEMVRPPNPFLVNALQHRRVRRAHQSTLETLSASFLDNAAELSQSMVDDIDHALTQSHALKQPHHDDELPLIIVNRPIARELRDYEEARARYLAHARQEPAVLGVYQYGNITYPGLSDLDLVVCISDTIESIDSARLAVESLSQLDRNVILHSPIVAPLSQIPYLREFLIDSTLQKIWAAHDLFADLPVLSASIETYSKLAKLFETLFSYRIWISEVLTQQLLDARWAIPSLKSIVYSCNIMESITGNTFSRAAAYRAAVQDLRANWFLEDSRYRQNVALRAMFRHGLQVIVSLMIEFDCFVQRSGWLIDHGEKQPATVTFPSFNVALVFDDQPINDMSRIITHARQINLPRTFRRFLDVYGHAINDPNRQSLSLIPRTDFEDYLRQRVERIGEQMRFLKRHRMNFGSYLPWQQEQFLSDTRHY